MNNKIVTDREKQRLCMVEMSQILKKRNNPNWLKEFAEFNIKIHGRDVALNIARNILRDKKCDYPLYSQEYLKVLSQL